MFVSVAKEKLTLDNTLRCVENVTLASTHPCNFPLKKTLPKRTVNRNDQGRILSPHSPCIPKGSAQHGLRVFLHKDYEGFLPTHNKTEDGSIFITPFDIGEHGIMLHDALYLVI